MISVVNGYVCTSLLRGGERAGRQGPATRRPARRRANPASRDKNSPFAGRPATVLGGALKDLATAVQPASGRRRPIRPSVMICSPEPALVARASPHARRRAHGKSRRSQTAGADRQIARRRGGRAGGLRLFRHPGRQRRGARRHRRSAACFCRQRSSCRSTLQVYENSGQVTDAVANGACDLAFMPRDAAREAKVDFGPAYYFISSTYLVPAGSKIQTSTRSTGRACASSPSPTPRPRAAQAHRAAMRRSRKCRAST